MRHTARLHTDLWKLQYTRYPGSRLGNGIPTAHTKHRLMLLGSPPDMVHGFVLRGTGSSSPLTRVRQHIARPGAGIHPCCSGLQVQGTAISPISAALPCAALRPQDKVFSILHHFLVSCNRVCCFLKITLYKRQKSVIISFAVGLPARHRRIWGRSSAGRAYGSHP